VRTHDATAARSFLSSEMQSLVVHSNWTGFSDENLASILTTRFIVRFRVSV
jgi:hypothetical protein